MKTKTKPAPKAKTEKNKPTLICFLLDRSGSMANCWDETIGGFNGYLTELRKNQTDGARFTLTQFDTVGIDVMHDATPIGNVGELSRENYVPRGGTPLYDAMGKTIRAAEAKAGDRFKVLFVTQTDGQENSSSEWNETTIKQLIKDKESNSAWTFAYLGMGVDGWSATARMAAGTFSANNVMRTTGKNSKKAYATMARASTAYMHSTGACGQSVNATVKDMFSSEDKDQTK